MHVLLYKFYLFIKGFLLFCKPIINFRFLFNFCWGNTKCIKRFLFLPFFIVYLFCYFIYLLLFFFFICITFLSWKDVLRLVFFNFMLTVQEMAFLCGLLKNDSNNKL